MLFDTVPLKKPTGYPAASGPTGDSASGAGAARAVSAAPTGVTGGAPSAAPPPAAASGSVGVIAPVPGVGCSGVEMYGRPAGVCMPVDGVAAAPAAAAGVAAPPGAPAAPRFEMSRDSAKKVFGCVTPASGASPKRPSNVRAHAT